MGRTKVCKVLVKYFLTQLLIHIEQAKEGIHPDQALFTKSHIGKSFTKIQIWIRLYAIAL